VLVCNQFVNLLKDGDWVIRLASQNALSQLSEQGKTVKLSDVALLMTIIAEFRPFIGPAIPEIVELLKHNGSEVRETAVYTLTRLSEQGKTAKLFNVALPMTTIAEFRTFIATTISEFVNLLKDSDGVVLAGVNALLQLSKQGKTAKLSDVPLLMMIIAEFQPLIASAIPEIVKLLKHTGWEVRKADVDALSRLSEQGKTVNHLSDVALLMTIIAEFRPLIATAIPEFVNLLKDSDVAVRWGGKNTLSQLSEQGKTVKLSDVALLMTTIAEFRPLIASTIPEIVKLLKHTGWEVRQAGVNALSQLSKQGKIAQLLDVALLMRMLAEFRPLIGAAIPEILELLKDREWEVCLAGVDALSPLSEHCKMVKSLDVALLMTVIAEFRPLIGPAIPEIIKLLKHTRLGVCRAGVDTLSQLSEHGKMDNVSDIAFLMTIIAEFRPMIGPAIPEIVELLRHCSWVARGARDALSQLSKQGKTAKLSDVALLMTIIAEFRPLIASAILRRWIAFWTCSLLVIAMTVKQKKAYQTTSMTWIVFWT
jgi:HEAT repeat protein